MRVYYLLICIVFFSCAKQQKQKPSAPIVVFSTVKSNLSFQDCIKFNDGYLVATKEHQLYYLNSNFEIDPVVTKKIQPNIAAKYFYTDRDNMLMAISDDDDDPTYVLTEDYQWKVVASPSEAKFFFEDDTYIITATCHGEFGGTTFFTHKKTQEIYSCETTCLSQVNTSNGVYYLTTNLEHMIGFSSIIKVADPTKLTALGTREKVNNWWIHADISREEIQKGTEVIFDTLGLVLFDSFVMNDKIYALHENSSQAITFGASEQQILLSTVDALQLKAIDTLLSYPPDLYLATEQKTSDFSFFHFNAKPDIKESMIVVQHDTVRVISLERN